MCNFIVRPIKSYATIDLYDESGDVIVRKGDSVEIKSIIGKNVVSGDFAVPLEVFVHSFSDKDPNKKSK
jgi:hypothetical protein